MRGQVSPSVRRRKQTKGKIKARYTSCRVGDDSTEYTDRDSTRSRGWRYLCCRGRSCQATSRSGPCCLYRIQSVLYLLHNGNRAGWETMEARLYLHSLAHPLQGTHTIRTRTCSMYVPKLKHCSAFKGKSYECMYMHLTLRGWSRSVSCMPAPSFLLLLILCPKLAQLWFRTQIHHHTMPCADLRRNPDKKDGVASYPWPARIGTARD